jgi:hypothetical protein
VGTRIFPCYLPQTATRPALTYSRVTGGSYHNLGSATGAAIPTFEIDAWADSYEAADVLAEAIRQEMQGFRGTMGSDAIKTVVLDDEEDAYEAPDDGSDNGVFRITLRYRIMYTESIPTF